MRALLARLRQLDAAHVTGALVVGLIATDIFSSGRALVPTESVGTVQNYVLFTTVAEGAVTVTTGIQFVSTNDRRIDSQWCYIARSSGDDTLDPHVTVATASASGNVTRATVSPEAVARFGLTAEKLAQLVEKGCRFQRRP